MDEEMKTRLIDLYPGEYKYLKIQIKNLFSVNITTNKNETTRREELKKTAYVIYVDMTACPIILNSNSESTLSSSR